MQKARRLAASTKSPGVGLIFSKPARSPKPNATWLRGRKAHRTLRTRHPAQRNTGLLNAKNAAPALLSAAPLPQEEKKDVRLFRRKAMTGGNPTGLTSTHTGSSPLGATPLDGRGRPALRHAPSRAPRRSTNWSAPTGGKLLPAAAIIR